MRKKPSKKKAPPKKSAPKIKAKVKTAKKKVVARLKAQALPGMEQVRHVKLDRLCEGISECRAEMNEQRSIEGEKCRAALVYMHDNKVTTYRFAGVELVRVPGEEKLRVRTTKESATLETEDEGTGQAPEAIGEALTGNVEDADDPSPVSDGE
jgi:hypothetical protein